MRRALFVLALIAVACADEADRAAKARIFSPEDPAPDLQRAAEALDSSGASSDPALWKRLWTMDRLEATRRLGAHKATTKVSLKWTRAGRTVDLVEEYKFETDANGDFRAVIQNDEDAGLEFVWAGGEAFAKSRFGPFRRRRIDRAQQDVWRDQATGALRTAFELGNGRLRATPAGPIDVRGRSGHRFALALGEQWGEAEAASDAPPVLFGQVRDAKGALVTGPDDDTRRRLDFDRHVKPESVAGHVVFDAKTGVILEGRLQGRYAVPEGDEAGARLALDIVFDVRPDEAVKVEKPAKIADTNIPHAVKDPLGFLGITDKKKGAAAAEPADESDE